MAEESYSENSEPAFDNYPAPLDKVREFTERYNRKVGGKPGFFSKLIVRIVLGFFKLLTAKGAYRLGTFFGWLGYKLGIRKKIAMVNLDIAFKDNKSLEEKDDIYRKSMINFGRYMMNFFCLPFNGQKFFDNHVKFEKIDTLATAMNKGKGALLISGHLGMWDIAAGVLGMKGFPVALVAKKIRNPAFDQAVIDLRQAMNFGTIKHRDSMGRILEGINRGEAIAMAVDQNMKTSQGVFIDWMGRPASSVKSAAYVVKQTGAPVIMGYMEQTGPDSFELHISDELEWEEHPDPQEELLINTQRQSHAFQKMIWERPDLWFWIHRRWKKQPEGLENPYE